MKTLLRSLLLTVLAAGFAAPVDAAAGELKLTMQDGRVTIIAANVPLRQILQEWARVGQTTIVNAERLPNTTVTLQLHNATEREALDVILRSANGYIAAPRPAHVAGAAAFDRITIFVSSKAAPAQAAGATPPPFQRPPQPIDEDEPINVVPGPMNNINNGQINNGQPQFPGLPPALQQQLQQNQQMQLQQQIQQQNQGLPAPGMSPMTVPRPGALPQPGLPNGVPNPYQPGVRPGGPGGFVDPSAKQSGG
jgi:hypothetical protein